MDDRLPSIADHEMLHAWQARRVAAWGRLLIVVIVLVMLGVLGRIVQLKLEPDPRMAAVVGTAMSSRDEIGRRGDLVDRRGRVIATSTVGYRLFIDPEVVADLNTIAADLGHILREDPVPIDRAIHERLSRNPNDRYIVVKDLVESWQADAIREAKLRGVGLDPRLVRHYPFGDLAAGLVGRVGFEHTGLSGLEHRLNRHLLPERGRLVFLRDARRNPLWIEPDGYNPSRDGENVRLSIDLVIQEIAERRLERAVKEQNAGGGRIVVIDCTSGEILAMHDVLNERTGWSEFTDDPGRDIHPAFGRNRCVTDPYEPGSTFKPFVWSVATELGRANPTEELPTPEAVGHRTSYGRLIRDSHYYGPSTWRKVLVKSMNTGMSIVAERMTENEMQSVVERFGFGERTSCGVPGETPGLVTSARDWNEYTQCSVAMGHEIAVTPVQMARAFCAFARDGTMPNLRLTALPDDDDAYRFIRRALPEPMALETREVLRDVMLEGTGRRAQSEKYRLFGKSGTAQLPKKEGGGYHEHRYVSSFVAGAPLRQPRIVCICVLDDPDRSKGHYGGAIAGPVVRDVIDATLLYLGVPSNQPETDENMLARNE